MARSGNYVEQMQDGTKVLYVDVGNLPKLKADNYTQEMQLRIRSMQKEGDNWIVVPFRSSPDASIDVDLTTIHSLLTAILVVLMTGFALLFFLL